MNFSDYLTQLPSNLVFEGLIKHSGQPRKILTSSMVREIADQFSSEKNLSDRFSKLSEEAKFLCSLAYLFLNSGLAFDKAPLGDLPEDGRAPDNLLAKIKNNEETDNVLISGFNNELIRSFLVHAACDEKGRMYYVGFEEFEPKLRKLFSQTIVKRTQVQAEKEALYSPIGLFLNDVTVIVALWLHRKSSKKQKRELLENQPFNMSINFCILPIHPIMKQIKMSRRPLLPLSYAVSRRLLHSKGDGYAVSHARMLAWLSKPLHSQYNDFIEFACASALLWRKSLLLDMLHKPGKPWLSSQGFGEKLWIDVSASIKMLAYCGLVDFYRSGGSYVFTRSGQEHCRPGGYF